MGRDAKLHHDPFFFKNPFFNILVGLYKKRLLNLMHKTVTFLSILHKKHHV